MRRSNVLEPLDSRWYALWSAGPYVCAMPESDNATAPCLSCPKTPPLRLEPRRPSQSFQSSMLSRL